MQTFYIQRNVRVIIWKLEGNFPKVKQMFCEDHSRNTGNKTDEDSIIMVRNVGALKKMGLM